MDFSDLIDHTWPNVVIHVWTWSKMDCVWLALVGTSLQLTLTNLALFSLRGIIRYILKVERGRWALMRFSVLSTLNVRSSIVVQLVPSKGSTRDRHMM